MAMAAAASTTGTALSTTQGSCLPLTSMMTGVWVLRSTVFCFMATEGVGLKAVLNTMGIPEAMPPRMPPWLLDVVTTFPSGSKVNGSLWNEPLILVPSKPDPNSMPLTAGMANTASEILPSSPSKYTSPQEPGLRPMMPHSTIPPTESPLAAAACTTSSNPMGSFSPPISTISAITWIPSFSRSCLIMPPAITSPTVSLALALPPPEVSASSPSFIISVKSA